MLRKSTGIGLFFASLGVAVYVTAVMLNGTILKSQLIYNLLLQELFALPLIFIIYPGLTILSTYTVFMKNFE